jgi:hypothetical protein
MKTLLQKNYKTFSTQQLKIAWEKYMCLNLSPFEIGTNTDFINLCNELDSRKITPWSS